MASPTEPSATLSSELTYLTQRDLIARRKEEQRAKSRARMVRYRSGLKDLPKEEQEAVRERARQARARYRYKVRQAGKDLLAARSRQVDSGLVEVGMPPSGSPSSSSAAATSSPESVAQRDLMAWQEEQRVKSRARMARYRSRLKELPEEEQAAPRERARASRARYRYKTRRAHAPQDSIQCQLAPLREAKLEWRQRQSEMQDASQTNIQSYSTRRPREADLNFERDDIDDAQQNTRCSTSLPPPPHAHVMRHTPSPPHHYAHDMPRDYGGYIYPPPPHERHATYAPQPPLPLYTPQSSHSGDISCPSPHSASPPPQVARPDDAGTKLNNSVRRRCFNCCTTETSMWLRSNLAAGEVLCNKCGLYEHTHTGPRLRPNQFTHKHGSLGDPADRSRSPTRNGQPAYYQPPEYPPRSASVPPPGAFRVLSSHWRTQTTQ
ncbi:hypothetical protein DFH06DRAFT_1470079 [Mycena polygramma]|nr:hypothetical protein DFH06DRAFT_1470079 [Mycena polygramma]